MWKCEGKVTVWRGKNIEVEDKRDLRSQFKENHWEKRQSVPETILRGDQGVKPSTGKTTLNKALIVTSQKHIGNTSADAADGEDVAPSIGEAKLVGMMKTLLTEQGQIAFLGGFDWELWKL